LLLIKDAEVLDYGPTEALAERHAEFLAQSETTPLSDVSKRASIVEDDDYGELP
jgi:hypothetical protein